MITRCPSACKNFLAVLLLASAPLSQVQAMMIEPILFGFTTDGETVSGEISGLNPVSGLDPDGVTRGRTGGLVEIFQSPFEGSTGTFPTTTSNIFVFDTSGNILAADFVGENVVGGTTFRIDFNVNPSGIDGVPVTGDVITLSGSGDSIASSGLALTTAFNFTPTNQVPSPAPLFLLSAGGIGFMLSRKIKLNGTPRKVAT